jgi:hypothetical protein
LPSSPERRAHAAHVQVDAGRHQDDNTLITRTIQIDSDIRQSGYEQFASLARTWRASFLLDRAGKLRAVSVAAQNLLPPIRLCTQPRLTAGNAKLTQHVIGTRLSYSTIAGRSSMPARSRPATSGRPSSRCIAATDLAASSACASPTSSSLAAAACRGPSSSIPTPATSSP